MNVNTETGETIDPEIVKDEITLSRPSVLISIEDLADLPKGLGLEKIQNRHDIVERLRRDSVALTFPQDWVLFKTREGAVTAYIQNSGCKRFWQIWLIEIQPIGDFEKITDDKTGDFAFVCRGNGISRATQLFVEGIEGVRYSTEDYCKDLSDLQKIVRVKQAAIANRDGNIIRALTGLNSVAIEFLEDVWSGTGKTTDKCSLGKGYGTKHERAGQSPERADIKAPICDECQSIMLYVKGGTNSDGSVWKPYWKCKQYKWDSSKRAGNGHSKVDAGEWEKTMEAARIDAEKAAAAQSST